MDAVKKIFRWLLGLDLKGTARPLHRNMLMLLLTCAPAAAIGMAWGVYAASVIFWFIASMELRDTQSAIEGWKRTLDACRENIRENILAVR